MQSFFPIVAKLSQFLERHHSFSLGKKVCLGALKSKRKEIEGGNSAPLLSPGEASAGVLCPLLGPSVQESPGVNPQGGLWRCCRVWNTSLMREAEGTGPVWAEEDCEGIL